SVGMSAARIPALLKSARISLPHVPFQKVGPTPLPEFDIPYPARVNPHRERAGRNVLAWPREMGMFSPQPRLPVPVWTAETLTGMALEICAASLDPDAEPEALDLATQSLACRTYGDDCFPALSNPHRERAGRTAAAWARELGRFSPRPRLPVPVWTAETLTGMALETCAASLDPAAGPEALALATQWLACGTYGDDYLPALFNRDRDMAGAKLFNARVPAFLPLDCGATP